MANLAALLAAYTFGPGDTIYVDNGSYNLLRDVVLSPQDSGVTIVGPSTGAAVLDRGDTNPSIYTVELEGATNVTLDQLQITGGYDGVYASNTAGSTGLTINNSTISANNLYGVYLDSGNDHAILSGNTVFGIPGSTSQGQSTDLYLASNDDTVSGNTVYQNAGTGIAVSSARDGLVSNNEVYGNHYGISVTTSGNATGADRVTVSGNTVFDNTVAGITASGSLVTGNTVYGQLSPGAVGIQAYSSEVADNLVYTNVTGISAQGGSIHGNRLYNNSNAAVFVQYSGSVYANQIYSNAVGIETGIYYSGSIYDNLVYANTDDAILVQSTYNSGGVLISSNTVYQPLGNAVAIEDGSSNVSLYNNILYVLAGYAIYVAPDSEVGFSSDNNDLFKGIDPNAHIGYWTENGSPITLDSLSAWQAATGTDAHSLSADPLLVDIAGADNILGYAQVAGAYRDGGADDNFFLDAGSPAIDAGNSWLAPPTDFMGDSREDDPGTPNTGSPDYFASVQSSSLFTAGGTAQNWSGTNTYFNLTLPFAFTFYGTSYTQVQVSTEGFLQFDYAGNTGSASDSDNSDAALVTNRRIAPLWANLTTSNIFVDASQSGQVAIRWQGVNLTDNSEVNFDVVLFANGDIRFDYGAGNTNLDATVGLSYGNGWAYKLPAGYDGQSSLTDANSVIFTLAPGFVDIGAFEFEGSSLDHTPPTVVSTNPVTINNGGTSSPFSQFQVSFSEAVNPVDTSAPALYELREAGSNGFGSPDDVVYALTPIYTPGSTIVTVNIGGLEDGTLPAGSYQLMIFSNATSSIHDLSGNALDGDDNGTPGGDYVRTFTINATATTTVVMPGTVSVAFGQSAAFTATVSSSSGTPSDGFVQFLVDGSAYGSPVPLSGGSAKLAIAEPAGSYTIAARYTGDTSYAATVPAGETTATLTVAQSTVTKTATTTVVTPGTVFVTPGQSATFTAAVSSSNGTPPDGALQFLVNGLNYGSLVTLSGGTAQLAISEPLGTYTIAAQYTGDADYAATLPAAETTATLTVSQPTTSKVATTTVVSPSTVSVGFGQSATFTATVSSLAGTPTDGSIQFLVNGSAYLTPVLVSGGQAQLAIAEPAGTYTVAAQYTGDSVYAATVSAAETTATLTVTQLATSTAITPCTATVSLGQSATFTATVSSSNGTPSDGAVQFLINGSASGNPVPVSNGTAQLAISEPMGSYTITAQYLGDTNYEATLVTAESTAGLTVTAATTTTTVTPGTVLVAPGNSATFTAAVTSLAGAPPDGAVQFLVSGLDYGGLVTLSGGAAQLAITEPLGSYAITAQYTGDGASFSASPVSAVANLVVANSTVSTTTALQSSEDPSKLGDSVTFTATVSPAQGSVTPTGTVQFSIDDVAFGSPVSLANGVAVLTTTSLTVGGHTVTAVYTSDSSLFNTSNGTLLGGQTIEKADVTVGLAADHSISVFGQTVNFTATVAAVTTGLHAPTGTVTFSEGSTVLGSAPLNAGHVSIPTSALPIGDDSIIASYGGDSNFGQNTSAVFTETVNPVLAATSIAAVSPNPRNATVSSVGVTFNEPVDLASFTTAALTLSDNGGANLITNAVTIAAVSGTTYAINGLAGQGQRAL